MRTNEAREYKLTLGHYPEGKAPTLCELCTKVYHFPAISRVFMIGRECINEEGCQGCPIARGQRKGSSRKPPAVVVGKEKNAQEGRTLLLENPARDSLARELVGGAPNNTDTEGLLGGIVLGSGLSDRGKKPEDCITHIVMISVEK